MEIDLEGPAPTPAPAAEPAPEPVAAVATPEPLGEPEPEPDPEPVPTAAPEPKPKRGMLDELIAERTGRREAEGRLRQYETDPALQRLTPEIRQAIAEGRIVVKPPQSNADAERERLKEVAEEIGLYKEGTREPDIEQAGRIDRVLQKMVDRRMGPLQEKIQHTTSLTMQQRADKNMASIWAQAKTDGVPEEAMAIAYQEFQSVMSQPNAAAILAQPEVAETVFERAMGRAWKAGKLPGTAKPKAPTQPAAIITEPAGRRGPAAAAIQLSPALAQVYKDHGMDPNKTPSATKPPQVDSTGHMELE